MSDRGIFEHVGLRISNYIIDILWVSSMFRVLVTFVLYNALTKLDILICQLQSWFNISGEYMFKSGVLHMSHPYSEPVYTSWSSVHWNATGMSLVDPVCRGIPLGDPANTCRVQLENHWKNLVETVPHWNATEEALTTTAYIKTPLEGL